jgi:predicted nucleic acid-binding protein
LAADILRLDDPAVAAAVAANPDAALRPSRETGAPERVAGSARGARRATTERIARRAGQLRYAARLFESMVDALVVATAEQDGGAVVITSDPGDLRALPEPTTVVVRPLP